MNKKFTILFISAIILVYLWYQVKIPPVENFENTDGILDKIMNSYSELNTKVDNIKTQPLNLSAKLTGPELDFIAGKFQTVESGGTILNKNTLQKMTSSSKIGGYGIDGNGTTHLAIEGKHNLNEFKWGGNLWDAVYILRGWKIRLYYDDTYSDLMTEDTNTSYDVKEVSGVSANRAQSYDLIWVGY